MGWKERWRGLLEREEKLEMGRGCEGAGEKRGIEEKMAWEGGRDRKEREVIGDEEGGEILREAREGG